MLSDFLLFLLPYLKKQNLWLQVKNTYYIPNQARLLGHGGNPEDVGGNEIKYYQWVPIIISFMIFMFSIPGISVGSNWKMMSSSILSTHPSIYHFNVCNKNGITIVGKRYRWSEADHFWLNFLSHSVIILFRSILVNRHCGIVFD